VLEIGSQLAAVPQISVCRAATAKIYAFLGEQKWTSAILKQGGLSLSGFGSTLIG